MKIMIRLFICLFLLALLIPAPLVKAKGAPDKITITSPGLAVPIEVTDPEILNKFNPWDGHFLDKNRSIVTGIPEADALYKVLFYFKDTSGEFHMFYAFQYSPELSGGRVVFTCHRRKKIGMRWITKRSPDVRAGSMRVLSGIHLWINC